MRSIEKIKREIEQLKSDISKAEARREILISQIQELTGTGDLDKAKDVVKKWKIELEKLNKQAEKINGILEDFLNEHGGEDREIDV